MLIKMNLRYALQHPYTKTIDRLVRRHGSYKRFLLIVDASLPTYTGIPTLCHKPYSVEEYDPVMIHLPLYQCFYCHLWLLRLFLARGFNPETMVGKWYRGIIHYASVNDARDVVKLVVAASSATLEQESGVGCNFGNRPLFWAILKARITIAKILLSFGADVHSGLEDDVFRFDFAPIRFLLSYGSHSTNSPFVTLLCESGATLP